MFEVDAVDEIIIKLTIAHLRFMLKVKIKDIVSVVDY